MTGRREHIIPAGWLPTVHSTVQILDSATLPPADVPVAGLWRCVDRAPAAGWWLLPADEAAQRWLAVHGRRAGAVSGCLNVHGLRLAPHWLQLTL